MLFKDEIDAVRQRLSVIPEYWLCEMRDMLQTMVGDSPYADTWSRLLNQVQIELGRRYEATASAPPSGCCRNCKGTAVDAASLETAGLCWDCRGTGHTHLLGEECDGGLDPNQP